MPGYIPRYCAECSFFKNISDSAGWCLAWCNNRLPYERICRSFAEHKHFDPFTGELVESKRSKSNG